MSDFATMNRATILALRLCAARLDTKLSPEQFAQLVADFREAVEAEAFERPPARVNDQPSAEVAEVLRRRGSVGVVLTEHSSTGAAEAKPKADQLTNPDTAASEPSAAPSLHDWHVKPGDIWACCTRCGARGDEARCVEPCSKLQPVLPAAERHEASPSQEGVGSATGGAASHIPAERTAKTRGGALNRGVSARLQLAEPRLADETPRAPGSRAIAEPAPSTNHEPDLSAGTDDGAGTSPASDAEAQRAPAHGRAEGSQRQNKRGGQRAMTDEDCRKLCAEYDQTCKDNGGKAPYGWIAKKVAELGLGVSTVRRALGLDGRGDGKPAEQPRTGSGKRLTPEQVATLRADYDRALRQNGGELPHGWLSEQALALGCTQQSISYRVHTWADEPARAPAPKANGHAAAAIKSDPIGSNPISTPRAHTNGHACWCRKQPSSTKNPWCSIAKPAGTIAGLAGLQDKPPRVDRYFRRGEGG